MQITRIEKSGRPIEDRHGVAQGRIENEDSLAPSQGQGESQAFTRCELLVVLSILTLLGILAVPVLANNRARSDHVVCQSNLRQIGHAFISWADDHGGTFPFLMSRATGGNNDIVLCNNAWFQYYWLSNELMTPRILACPADTEKRVSDDWSASPVSGFNHSNARDKSCSYPLAIGTRQSPHGLLSGDRNIKPTNRNTGGCAAGPLYGGVASLNATSPTLDWMSGLHQYSGNLLLNDGSVLSAGRDELRRTVQNSVAPGGTLCVLYPLPTP